MKKSIAIALLLAMVVGSVQAGLNIVLNTEGDICVCSGVFTTSGKTVVYSINNNKGKKEITVYTPDFLVDKTFACVTSEYKHGSVTEEATVTLTGLNVVPETPYGSKNYYTNQLWLANSQDEMINNLREQSPYSTIMVFTDAMGNPACYDYENTSYKYENLFGKKYPTSWYALIGGYVYRVYTYDSFYTIVYDEESAVWIRTEDNVKTSETIRLNYLRDPRIEGMANEHISLYITQNLFNDDDKWEYIVEDFSGAPQIDYTTPSACVNQDGTVTLTRIGYIVDSNCYAVYNEDGEKLGNIPWNNIFVINGKAYVGDSNKPHSLYSIDKNGSDFDLVETVCAKNDRSLDTNRGIVTIEINSEQAGGEVIVSTTDGKVMANKRVGVGQTQINDQPLPTGIYIVSLLKEGRVVESEKYLVQ